MTLKSANQKRFKPFIPRQMPLKQLQFKPHFSSAQRNLMGFKND